MKPLWLFCSFLAAAVHAEPAQPEANWLAQWIGRSRADAALSKTPDLSGASWIWTAEAGVDPTRNAPGGSRHFQREIRLPADAKVTAAAAVFSADNHFVLSVNGQKIGKGDRWEKAEVMDVAPALRPGRNVIDVEAVNDPADGPIAAAGLVGKIRIELQNLPPVEMVTDQAWRGKTTALPDGQWSPVQVVGRLGEVGPWGKVAVKGADRAKADVNLWTCFRKSFALAEAPKSAIARIAVDSKYWLWVNGQLVVREGGLKRGPNPQDTYFDAVDLAPHLRKGDNTIAVLAWYFGKDGFSHKSSGKAGFLFELKAGATRVLSDSTWKNLIHPAFGEAANTPNFRLSESSVHFDAQRDLSGWTAPGFDDHAWPAAHEFGRPPVAPWNRLWLREIPQWKDFGLKDYENAPSFPSVSDGKPISARLPYNAQVTPWLRISAPAGQFIKIGTDDAANEIFAEYITKEGEQEFETPAWMNGHHVVYQIPEGVKILGLKFRETGFDTGLIGRFACDDDFLNRLWTKCERTLYVNMRDNFFDCPDRERAQWWGDIVIQLGQVFYTFDGRAHTLIRKCIQNLCNWQRPTKTLYSPIPTGNWDKELPQQMLASVGQYGFWTYYQNTGDRQTLADAFPHARDYLSIWQTDADGLIVHRSGENGWDWADWGENVDIRVLDQAWFCLALEGAANMADTLGKPAEAAAYRRQREQIIAAVNKKFWNGSAYRDPGYGGATDDRAQGMAVVSGIAGPEKYPAIKSVLEKEFHASPYIEKYILESLFQMGDAPAAQARLKKRYQEMVDSETSTLWELFSRGGTLNHAWTGGPLTLMMQYVAGIAPTSTACATYHVRPQMGSLREVTALMPGVNGNIRLELRQSPEKFTLNLTSPEKTKATVCLPMAANKPFHEVRANGKTVWKNGQPANPLAGLQFREQKDGCLIFEAAPGHWEFVGVNPAADSSAK